MNAICVNNTNKESLLTLGKVYSILEADNGMCTLAETGGRDNWFISSRFRLINEEETMDIKLKDISSSIRTRQPIMISMENGEEFCPSVYDLESYKEYYVTDIMASGNILTISIQALI